MYSKTAAASDESYVRLQLAGEEYLLEELNEEVVGLKKAGATHHNEIMYWSGYTYHYWHYYTSESGAKIYAIALAETMVIGYLGLYTLDVMMSIDMLKESNSLSTA